MDEPHNKDDLSLVRYSELRAAIEEIRLIQNKIASALLGTFDNANSPGLIEETRNLRKDVDSLNKTTVENKKDINSLVTFRADVKKIVIAIAFIVPICFELLKGIVVFLWEQAGFGKIK